MPGKSDNKDTLVLTKFPWETLGAETLRAVIRDLGVNAKTIQAPQKRVYVQFLQLVSDKGLEAACKVAQSAAAQAETSTTRSSSAKTKSLSPKRKAEQMEPELTEYNTRYKGKRQRVWGPGGVSRESGVNGVKKTAAAPKPISRNKKSDPSRPNRSTTRRTRSAPPAKRRGRNSQPKAQAPVSVDSKREVFDGVVLPPPSKGKQKEIETLVQSLGAPLGQLVVGEDGLLELDGHFEPDTDFVEIPETIPGLPSPPGHWNEPYSDSNKENQSAAEHLGVGDAHSTDYTIQVHAPSHQGQDSEDGDEPAVRAPQA